MDRPKHRWFIVLGALLACGVVLLGRHWVSTSSNVVSAPASVTATQVVEPEPRSPASTGVEAAAPANPTSVPAATAGGTFRGRVIDAVTRQPVREFEVRLMRIQIRDQSRTMDEPLTRTFRSGSGRFAWSGLEPSRWVGVVSAHGYQQFELREFTIAAGDGAPELVLPLLHGFTVHGRVFDVNTGVGISEAYVSFVEPDAAYHGDNLMQPFANSKEDGTYELDGVPGGDVTLAAGAKGYTARDVKVIVNEETPAVDFGLSTGGAISGRVLTAAGAPVKGMIMLSGPSSGPSQTTDEGVFSFGQLPAGSYVLMATTPAGSGRQEIELAPEERKSDVILTVVTGRTVSGTIRGLQSSQLERAFVSARSAAKRQFFNARPDEQGAYALKGLPPGKLTLSAWTSGRQFEKTIDVPADKDLVLDIVFPPGARLSGRVTQGGEPAAGKLIAMDPADAKAQIAYRAQTSQDGQYEIEGLPPGEYRLDVEGDIGRSIAIAGDTVLNIEIPSVQVGGRVLEDAGAVPIVGADIYVRGLDAATSGVRAHEESDHFGRFKLTGVEPGGLEILVYKPGYEMYREKIAYSSPITDKTIRLRRGGGVEVRVQLRSQGELPSGFYVTDESWRKGRAIEHWIPLDRNGIGYIPSALTGGTLVIHSYVGRPIEIRDWDGSPLDLKF
jgi:hypothetical protein